MNKARDPITKVKKLNNEQLRNPIEELAEEFMQRRRNGETPSVDDYARDHPELADQIRDLFPTLELIEHARDDVVGNGEIGLGRPVDAGQQLGDFQILREIGRGGMGVVYEAHQSSLGRRVALKVLSPGLQKNKKHLERFKREARTAANLQHANIVPVYGVTYEDGYHFYVMQFVYGCGLDEVFDALCREDVHRESLDQSLSADGIALALETGQFRAKELRIESGFQSQVNVDTEKQQHSKTQPPSERLSGNYFRRIAEIGCRAADALAYAHRNGVLHRDIKPGNLLLDVFGNIWITDFGPVKLSGEEGLTETGDIAGTLRYIAPECLTGQFDARSDLYGLGLTLHELLSREKAFSAVSRGELTQQILEQGPSLLQNVPRDLSTIIQKATAHDPDSRYQTAADFADDLGRFLDSQPIQARRTSAIERLWRWSKRNRKLAAALATSLLLLVSGLIGSIAFSFQLNSLANERQEAFVAADNESRDAKRRLVDANIARAEALAASQQPGQRLTGLAVVKASVPIARELKLGSDTIDRLRNAAISSLVNADVMPIQEWNSGAGTISDAAFDKRLTTYVVQPRNFGPIEIRRISDQSIISKIQGRKYWGWKWMSPDGRYVTATTHYAYGSEVHIYDTKTAKLVNNLGKPIEGFGQFAPFQFSQSSDHAVLATTDQFVRVYSIGNDEPVFEIEADADCVLFGAPDELIVCRKKRMTSATITDLFWNNDRDESFGRRIKQLIRRFTDYETESVAEFYSISGGNLTKTIKLSGPAATATFGPNDMLAVVCIIDTLRRDEFASTETVPHKTIDIFELPSEIPILHISSDVRSTQNVAFNETGRVLIVGFPNSMAIFDVRTGTRLLVAPGALKSTASNRIVYERLGRFGIRQLILSDVYRGLVAKQTAQKIQVDPISQFFVTPDRDGIRFFDLGTGSLLGHVRNYFCRGACFSPDGKNLFVVNLKSSGNYQLFKWPIERDQDVIRIGPPERFQIAPGFEPHHLAIDSTGAVLASEDTKHYKVGLCFLNEEREPIVMDGPNTLMFIALSDDLRYAATGTWYGNETAIYDLEKKKLVRKVFTGKSDVHFTQDSESLICGSGRIVDLDTWNERQIDTKRDQINLFSGFRQPAGTSFAYVALRNSYGKLAVIDTTDWSILATIQTSNEASTAITGMSAGGHRLIIQEFSNDLQSLNLMDIARLREHLKPLDLDWDAPDFTPFSRQTNKPKIVISE